MSNYNHERLYANVVTSLMKFVEDFRKVEMISPASQYLSWDEHAEIEELPSVDLIGLAGVGLVEEEMGQFEVACGIAVSTKDDPNLTRITQLVSKLRGLFRPGQALVVYDNETAIPQTFMISAPPIAVLPIGRAETRIVQTLEVRLLLHPGAGSALRVS